MKILVVEDDEFKRRWIAEAVSDCMPKCVVSHARSVNAGLSAIESDRPDVLLLDMSLTTFDVGPDDPGGRPQNFGGLEVLRQMDRLQISIPTIVITQYERFQSGSKEMRIDGLYQELKRDFGDTFSGIVYYNSAQGDWKKALSNMLRQLAKKRKRQ